MTNLYLKEQTLLSRSGDSGRKVADVWRRGRCIDRHRVVFFIKDNVITKKTVVSLFYTYNLCIIINVPSRPENTQRSIWLKDTTLRLSIHATQVYIFVIESALSGEGWTYTIEILQQTPAYSAFANSCPLQNDTFLFALIHSYNAILSSNKF